ncbi:MAG: 2'-deoxycytidine 5'-triphosphate deaminase [Acidimicrobiia bacterium]
MSDPLSAPGVLPDLHLHKAIEAGHIAADPYKIGNGSVQPASLDLTLGPRAHRLRCSFLPDAKTVGDKLAEHSMGEFDLRDGAILERNRPYLIPLRERLALPLGVRAKANPKSSTGRLDIFTRVITDRSFRFDEITAGYEGGLWLEVVSRSFTVRVQEGLSLNQLRLVVGDSRVSDDEIRDIHGREPLLFLDGVAVPAGDIAVADGLFMSLDLRKRATGEAVGFRAKKNSRLLDLAAVDRYDPELFWEPVVPEREDRLILEPEEFYLLLSSESVSVPPGFAAEMTAYDPTSGELRTHYAGFFDPGFGYDRARQLRGSRATLEVRAHDVPFMVEHRQPVCKLSFDRMLEPPHSLYGEEIGSHYQSQRVTLSKHFHPSSRSST